jgi:hypothetical protein
MEVVQRERYEEFQKTAHLGRVLGLLLGADPEGLRRAEETLEFAIYQTAWDPEAVRQHLQAARGAAERQREARLRDARLMDRVAGYSDDGDDDVAFSAADSLSDRRPTPGVTNAWKKRD